jgi:glycerol-3-phosphate dehydrogenase
LTSCFSIAERVEEYLELLGLTMKEKEDYNPNRPKPEHFINLSREEIDKKIKKNPAWGRIICRCETVAEQEIINAIHAPVGARTVDGVKFRCRPGMGRCQGGFCRPRVMEILSRELEIPFEEVTKRGEDTNIVIGQTKDRILNQIQREDQES